MAARVSEGFFLLLFCFFESIDSRERESGCFCLRFKGLLCGQSENKPSSPQSVRNKTQCTLTMCIFNKAFSFRILYQSRQILSA